MKGYYFRGVRFWRTAILAASLAMALSMLFGARAAAQTQINLGDQVTGTIRVAGDEDKYIFPALNGTLLSLDLRPTKGSAFQPTNTRLLDSDGVDVPLLAPDAKNRIKAKKLPLQKDGVYCLIIAGAVGDYLVKTKGKFPKQKLKLAGVVNQGGDDRTPFGGLPNAVVKLKLKPDKGSALDIRAEILQPNGPPIAVANPDAKGKIKDQIVLAEVGQHQLRVFGANNSEGGYKGKLGVKFAKSKQKLVEQGDDENTPPNINIDNPPDGSTIDTNTPLISVSYSNGQSGINTRSFTAQINGVDRSDEFTVTPTEATLQITNDPLPGGSSTIVASITDNAGNAAQATSTFEVFTFSGSVLPLFTQNDVWFPGSLACNAPGCHTGVGGAHDLHMGSHAGIMLGADAGDEPIVFPGRAAESPLRKRLRNNRMPWNISTTVPRNGPNNEVRTIERWINEGLLNDGDAPLSVSFQNDVLPLFTQNNVWFQGSIACNAPGCHTGIGGAHDLDMGTYNGVMLGADAGDEPIVFPGRAGESPLRKRLRNNRMPWGVSTSVPRNGPNGEVLVVEDWINAGAPNGAFTDRNAVQRDFANDVLPLFTQNDVWFPGSFSCNAQGCHTGIGGAHDLDMGSHAGIMLGADAGDEPIVFPGDAADSPLRKRLRNNRMSFGVPTTVPRNGPNNEVLIIEQWINEGALNDGTPVTICFQEDVLPLFTQNDVWFPGSVACNAPGCHTGVGGAHDLDMGSYAGIMLGADAGDEPIVFPGDAGDSGLRKRLRNNRMPWNIATTVPRNGPNDEVLLIEDWINAGAPDGDFTDRNAAQKNFANDVLPLFTQNDVWFQGSLACNAQDCHTGIGGAHDLDMGSHGGIMLGADAGDEPIVFPGRAGESPLRKRLRNNRMPWNITTNVPRNGPNNEVLIIEQWINEGALNDTRRMTVSFQNDVLPLFTQNDVWYQGGFACNAPGCHTGVGGAHDLDMGSYAGILLGADAGDEPIVFAGDAGHSGLRKRLRNNRMPWNIATTVPRNGPNDEVLDVARWINAGALNDNPPETVSFQNEVLPLFIQNDVWFPGSLACNAPGCHTGVGGAHDLDMGTYAGIMLGADAGDEPIVFPGDAGGSPLRKRLRNNRMPWSIATSVPRNGPNDEVLIIEDWINAGAPNGNFKDRNGVTTNFTCDVLPLFANNDVWFQGAFACNAQGCHTGIGGAHDLDMGSYDGIMLGADAGDEPIVFPGRAGESPLRKRLRNNRMPWSISTTVPRKGPNDEVLTIQTWINEGAKNN